MAMRTVLNPTALLSITLLVTAGIGMDAVAAGRTYVPKNEDTTPKMETCRLKKSTQVEGNTQCQYRRQTGGKDVFLPSKCRMLPANGNFSASARNRRTADITASRLSLSHIAPKSGTICHQAVS